MEGWKDGMLGGETEETIYSISKTWPDKDPAGFWRGRADVSRLSCEAAETDAMDPDLYSIHALWIPARSMRE
jgi:hypothetical protein